MNFRWTVRADAISGITTNYRHLLDLFGLLTKETDLEPEVNGRTVGAKFMLLDASTYYGKLFIRIMSLLHTGIQVDWHIDCSLLESVAMNGADGREVAMAAV